MLSLCLQRAVGHQVAAKRADGANQRIQETYEEVAACNSSVLRNRRAHLAEELDALTALPDRRSQESARAEPFEERLKAAQQLEGAGTQIKTGR
jgi:hypothetical protein